MFFSRTSLIASLRFRLWFVIIRGPTYCQGQSRVQCSIRIYFNTIIDMGLTAEDCKPVCYELDEKLLQMVDSLDVEIRYTQLAIHANAVEPR